MVKAFEKFNLSGKTALITGAAGLLGIEHSAALLQSGATVILTDIDEERLMAARETLLSLAANPGQILYNLMNVARHEEILETATKLKCEGLRIDVLVNNAAIDPKVKAGNGKELTRLENFTLSQWNLEIAVGLTGAFLCGQVFGGLMASDGSGGVILNIASDLSVIGPDQRLYRKEGLPDDLQPVKPVTYSVIKAGLVGLTRYFATYWADKGVRSNALSPSGVFSGQGDEFVKRLSALTPIGRMANRDEYRAAVQFLCSDASAYLNGQNIVMDGGRSVW